MLLVGGGGLDRCINARAAWPPSWPTTTQPPGRIPRAVVRPTPPGQGPGSLAGVCANTVCVPPGETCTIVVPVPCRLFTVLKLLTRTSPLTRLPVLVGTTTTP